MTHPTQEADVKAIRDSLSDYSQWAGRPTALENALAHIDAQAVRLDAAERDAARYQFVRAGGAYIEPNEGELYMADDIGGKYYKDMRDFDMDIDAAMERYRAAIASEAGK